MGIPLHGAIHDSIAARRERVRSMVSVGMTGSEIAAELGVSVGTVSLDKKALGISGKRGPRPSGDKAAERRERSAGRKRTALADRRRFRTTPVPMGKPAVLVPAETSGTRFPERVVQPGAFGPALKDGANNSKIGGDVLVGRLRGAPIFTLTLEERATCPRACPLWRGCYGNNDQHSRRLRHGPRLEAQLREEVGDLCGRHGTILVRLHVLGDFYSWRYLCLWADLLDIHPGLHVFGFTAWGKETKICAGVARLRGVYPQRFAIRHSGTTGRWGSFTVDFPTTKKRIGDALLCPEQRYAGLETTEARAAMAGTRGAIHCGNCAACWSSDVPVAFVEH